MENAQIFSGNSVDLRVPHVEDGFIKVFASGELTAGGADRRLLLEINGEATGYTSFVVMDGHAQLGEWDGSGIYLGRNGWFLDANFTTDFTISFNRRMQRIMCNGQSTFANGNNTILGYQCDGFLLATGPVKSLRLKFTGGVAEGVAWARGFEAPHELFG